MSDYIKPEGLVEEINRQGKQLHQAAMEIFAAVSSEGEESVRPDDVVKISQSLITLLTISVVSLAEISISLSHLANQGNRDFEAAVKAAAEDLATVKHGEETKRSFIGKRSSDA